MKEHIGRSDENKPTLHSRYGACMVSRNIYDKRGRLTWCIREESVRSIDNGWRFLSEIDTDEYLSNVDNWCVLAYESVIEIEPAVLAIYDMPVGTELTLILDGKKRYFADTRTGEPIEIVQR